MVHNTTQHPPTPPQSHTVCICCRFTLGRRGGVGKVREKVEGQQFTRGIENTNMTDCISKHQWRRHLGFLRPWSTYSAVPVGGPGDGVLTVRVVLLPLPLHILPNISTYDIDSIYNSPVNVHTSCKAKMAEPETIIISVPDPDPYVFEPPGSFIIK
jgi:hypothetical protein